MWATPKGGLQAIDSSSKHGRGGEEEHDKPCLADVLSHIRGYVPRADITLTFTTVGGGVAGFGATWSHLAKYDFASPHMPPSARSRGSGGFVFPR